MIDEQEDLPQHEPLGSKLPAAQDRAAPMRSPGSTIVIKDVAYKTYAHYLPHLIAFHHELHPVGKPWCSTCTPAQYSSRLSRHKVSS